ncbi:Protein usg (plasmid) [Sinorhizobium fredii HH103]|uniref:Protein usg n=1 Tax=Sinorhizobium fredii (strain HH103) TaxID=1117943 RepID=G9AC46_SINF1|nr:Protein usg [Sinorhizobium fredii HH103]
MASIACARFCRSEPSAANTDCLTEIWQVNLDGPLHSVRYTYQCLIRPNEWRRIEGEFKLH